MNKVTYISKSGITMAGLTRQENIYDFVAEMSKHEHNIEKVIGFSPATDEDICKGTPELF